MMHVWYVHYYYQYSQLLLEQYAYSMHTLASTRTTNSQLVFMYELLLLQLVVLSGIRSYQITSSYIIHIIINNSFTLASTSQYAYEIVIYIYITTYKARIDSQQYIHTLASSKLMIIRARIVVIIYHIILYELVLNKNNKYQLVEYTTSCIIILKNIIA